jgi:hypothetical protein
MTTVKSAPSSSIPTPPPEVRNAVKDLLLRSPAFSRLPATTQQSIAHDMTQVADYLARPEGIEGNKLPSANTLARPLDLFGAQPDASQSTYERDVKQVNKVGEGFQAVAARQGAEVAGMLMNQVKFVDFVSGLIQGVFHAIVTASIEQMEAYGKLVSSISKSLNQFRDENVTENQGRDHLVDQFPDLFEIGGGGDDFFGGGGGGPRVKLREGVEEGTALNRVNASLPMDTGPLKSLDLENGETEQKLVQSARTQLATSRQQLLATMVLMGINRIVVTDGKIQAKILYDFQARDNSRRQRSAAAYDFARDSSGNVQKTTGIEGDYESKTEGGTRTSSRDKESDSSDQRDANYYAKGTYKYSEKPVMTAMSTATESAESSLQTKASLAGVVDVNFKSDYFPLEKMADSFQIAQIQNASKPGRGVAPAGPVATPTPASGSTPAPTTPPPAPPAK